MKVAEALLERADLQKKLASLRERLTKNVLIQDGEKPSEDPKGLLEQVEEISDQLERLVVKINVANIKGRTGKKRSLTEAIAERDSLTVKHSILANTVASALKQPERYGAKEIRWIKTVDVGALQDKIDLVAKEIREINAEIQSANWKIDLT